MAHFAKLGKGNIVEEVIIIHNNDAPTEEAGLQFIKKLYPNDNSIWKQTSYNGNMRGNYAGIGYTYMTNVATLGVGSTDVFIPHQPFPSWSVGVNTAQWFAPIAEPVVTTTQRDNNQFYEWDEAAYQADTADPKTVGWALTTNGG